MKHTIYKRETSGDNSLTAISEDLASDRLTSSLSPLSPSVEIDVSSTVRGDIACIDQNCRNRPEQAFSPRVPPPSSLTTTRWKIQRDICLSMPVLWIQPQRHMPSSAHSQNFHASADSERLLIHVHNSSSKSQEISTNQHRQVLHAVHSLSSDQQSQWEPPLLWKRPVCQHHQNCLSL